jgi:hypothetical protein
MFGFYYALSMMGITPSNLSHDFLQEFIYLLRHRDFRPESLCTTLGLLEKAVKGIAI